MPYFKNIWKRLSNKNSQILRRLKSKEAHHEPVLCNLGCGKRYHPDWINIDFQGDGDSIIEWDLRQNLPIENYSCDAIYASHVIEHFSRSDAQRFLLDCLRVLKKGGVIRLVTPDLEDIVRTYLFYLEAARKGERKAEERYEWMVIELLDQVARHISGGEMLRLWSQDIVQAEDFIATRVGTEYHRARLSCRGKMPSKEILTPEKLGKFRLSGEIHQWLYDTYSLSKLLFKCGFKNIEVCSANSSSIPNFTNYNLDTDSNGLIYKPDSFFIEAKTP